MVAEPEKWVEPMADAGANMYTFHIEATEEPGNCIRKIREAGMKAGIGLKPQTPVDVVLPFITQVDMVLIMTVEPGFGGQKFMGDMMAKVAVLRNAYPALDIEVDGGVSPDTIDQCALAGANMIVSGTAVVAAQDQKQVISMMRGRVSRALLSRK